MSADDKLEAIVGGTAYDLTDLVQFVVRGDDGWGLPPIRRVTEQGPTQDGVTDRGYFLEPRILNMRLTTLPVDYLDKFTLRDRLLRIFAPRMAAIQLRRTIMGSLVRQVDCHLIDGGKYSGKGGDGGLTDDVFQLMCPDPTLYHPTQNIVVFGVGGGGSGFVVPMPVPHAVGASTIDETQTIVYGGSWPSFPIIRIMGPINDPVITNGATGDKLDFTGLTLATGAWVEVNCAFDHKTVVDNTGANQIRRLSNDSNLATFAIVDDRFAPLGYNPIQVTGWNANSATQVTFYFYTRYLGM